ncbi:serine/threonine protein kinase [Vibrio gallaecicus]|uniref:Serine/threonine protein kinase n=1 Tax=Vibrio gallaecicus TaxID=552386 RepID=A0ABV4NB86_9VIBR
MTNPTSSTELFYRLIDCNSDEQKAILADIDRTMPELVLRVEALLSSPSDDTLTTLIDEHLSSTPYLESSFEGEVVDRYRVHHELGRGGFGVVYFASRNDQVFERNFAIKFFKPEVVQLFGRKRLFHEAQLLANLNHPFIAKVYDAGLYEGLVYIVMEHVEGVALSEYLDTNQPTREDILSLFNDICVAIEHAHSCDIIHADLKPENILVDAQGKPKLIDFNLTQQYESSTDLVCDFSDDLPVRAASRDFASPEQISGQPITEQADIYALGRILDEMLQYTNRSNKLQEVIEYAAHDKIHLRYKTVSKLREDIENVRTLYPLNYRQQHNGYLALSFIHRNPVKILSGLLSTVFIIFFSFTYIHAYQRLELQRTNLDSILYELTTLNYPMNNRLLESIPNSSNQAFNRAWFSGQPMFDWQFESMFSSPQLIVSETFEFSDSFEVNINGVEHEDTFDDLYLFQEPPSYLEDDNPSLPFDIDIDIERESNLSFRSSYIA